MLTLICTDRFSHEITKVICAKFSSRIADILLNTSLNCKMSHKDALIIMKLCLCCIEISSHMIKIVHFSKLISFERAVMKQMNVSVEIMSRSFNQKDLRLICMYCSLEIAITRH